MKLYCVETEETKFILLLNPHGSDETWDGRYGLVMINYFLTHTVQMKQITWWVCLECKVNFLTHTVQMKLSQLRLLQLRKQLLNPHGSDETQSW